MTYRKDNKEYFTDPDTFFKAVKTYAADIKGTVLCADEIPYLGFVVFNDSAEDDKSKHFLMDSEYLNGWNIPEKLQQAMQSAEGKRVLAQSLSFSDQES